MKELGKVLKKARKNKGLTLEEVAEICGITPQYLTKIEMGQAEKIFPRTFKTLTDCLDLDVHELMKNEEKTLAHIVKAARYCKGYTQQEIAIGCGISIRTVNNIEAGKITKPKLDTLDKIMGYLDIALDVLTEVYEYEKKETVANIIKSARLSKGLTQGELARICGISIVYLSDIETGKLLNPKLQVLKNLSDFLELDLDKLMNVSKPE